MIKALRIIGVFMISSSMFLLCVGLYSFVKTKNFLEKAVKVEGTISEIKENIRFDHREKRTMYHPVFSFRDEADKEHNVHSRSSSSRPEYEVGESVLVLYDPQKPKDAKIESFKNLWFGTILALGMGVGSLAMASIFLFVAPIIIRSNMPNTTNKEDNDIMSLETQGLGRKGFLVMFFLTVVTFGIYLPIWMYEKTKKLNQLVPDNPISMKWVIVTFILAIICGLTQVVITFLAIDDKIADSLNGTASTMFWVSSVIVNFMIRNRINTFTNAKKGDLLWISGFMIFFFPCFYVQWKINGGTIENVTKGL